MLKYGLNINRIDNEELQEALRHAPGNRLSLTKPADGNRASHVCAPDGAGSIVPLVIGKLSVRRYRYGTRETGRDDIVPSRIGERSGELYLAPNFSRCRGGGKGNAEDWRCVRFDVWSIFFLLSCSFRASEDLALTIMEIAYDAV